MPRHCADQLVGPEQLAQGVDLSGHVLLFNHHPRPNAAHQLVFADRRSIRVDQGQQDIQGPRATVYRHTIHQQPALAPLKSKPAEPQFPHIAHLLFNANRAGV